MNDEQFSQMLEEIMGKIDNCPGSHPEALEKFVKKNEVTKEFQKIVNDLNDSLGAIRLMIKYLIFDLEATRRERDDLRMKLEDMS